MRIMVISQNVLILGMKAKITPIRNNIKVILYHSHSLRQLDTLNLIMLRI